MLGWESQPSLRSSGAQVIGCNTHAARGRSDGSSQLVGSVGCINPASLPALHDAGLGESTQPTVVRRPGDRLQHPRRASPSDGRSQLAGWIGCINPASLPALRDAGLGEPTQPTVVRRPGDRLQHPRRASPSDGRSQLAGWVGCINPASLPALRDAGLGEPTQPTDVRRPGDRLQHPRRAWPQPWQQPVLDQQNASIANRYTIE